ncbi:RNA polymerase sigma factor [Chitinophaga cymbidii]|uniref:DNA-directed RNA polymerase sigma-70 factor n=1 Tax=Chitinophaga cymbidii TaxID=1096750 RepID=A0A512RK71_9BACT|nr:sigma-70 family RNA polymerase sigma factor [Chitinophaga cymbidii]GEP96111.1 DNA-directed RNA polymerase sigma-70 factor [Chitinophaga cymbidii]
MYTTSDIERALFLQVAEGDEAAFRELFHIYTPLLRPLIYKLTKTEHVIEDILQEVFFSIWMSRAQLPAIENPRSWILKIAFHDCFGYLRKAAVRNRQGPAATEVFEDTKLEFRETARLVQEAVAQLPPQARKVYLLSRQEGMKLTEIAEELQLSLQTVKNTLSRALKSIRGYLASRGVFLPLLLLWYWLL